MQQQPDEVVISAFVKHLRGHGHSELRVDSFPDKHNRNSPDIDAIAFPFAIEHTSIDAVENRRRNQHWFVQFANPLRDVLDGEIPFYLRVILAFDSVESGPKKDDVRAAFKTWVRDESNSLPDGLSIVSSAEGIPFTFEAEKCSDGPPGLLFTRILPQDNTFVERMRNIIEKKSEKLRPYHSSHTTVLLIENDDMALMNKEKMLGAIHKNYPDAPPDGVDQIWYADTSSSRRTWFIHVTPYLKPSNHSIFGYSSTTG